MATTKTNDTSAAAEKAAAEKAAAEKAAANQHALDLAAEHGIDAEALKTLVSSGDVAASGTTGDVLKSDVQDYIDALAAGDKPVEMIALVNVPVTMIGGDPHYGGRIKAGETFEATEAQAETLLSAKYAKRAK